MYRLLAIFFVLVASPVLAGSDNIQEYTDMLNSRDNASRIQGIYNLGGLGINATQRGAMALIPLLEDEDEEIRQATIQALGQMKWEAKRAVPDLLDIMRKKDILSVEAALALIRIGSVEAKEEAEDFLNGRMR